MERDRGRLAASVVVGYKSTEREREREKGKSAL